MILSQRWSTALSSAIWIVLTAALWIAFAPLQVGGQAAYVIVNGNSMEPNYHLGDLIIVRPQSHYGVGDQVVYQNPDLGGSVFHRIVDLRPDRYILKGDNNEWTDAYQPTQEEVIGKLWTHLPRFGKILQFIRRPINMALIAGVLAGLWVMNIGSRQPKGRRRMKNRSLKELLSRAKKESLRDWISGMAESGFIKALRESFSKKPGKPPENDPGSQKDNLGGMTEGIIFVLGLLAFGALILVIFAFIRPATRLVPDNITYQHFGFFNYTATGPDSVYESGILQSGQPIFPKATCVIDINFQYTLIGEQAEGIGGSHQTTAILTEPQSGWQRVIPLHPIEPFTGTTFDTQANLDLCQVISMLEEMETETGYRPGFYTLSIVPEVTVAGTISGRELNDTFEPHLNFRYNRTHFHLIVEDSETDPLNPGETRLLQGELEEPNVLPILGLRLKVPTLRIISLLILGLSLGGIVMLGMQIQNLSRNDQPAFVRMKYEALIVDINRGGAQETSRMIDVTSIDDLAKLAERYNVMILHETSDDSHSYYVQGDGITYRFTDKNVAKKEH
jgi:signal peptidase I